MNPMKILFPTDFSDAARNAFVYNLHLAYKLKATVYVLHVYQKPEIKSLYVPRALEEFNSAYDLHQFTLFKEEIAALRQIATQEGLEDVALNFALEEGVSVVNSILNFSEKEQIELIVLGTTGAGALKSMFLGSVAAEILENSGCPVLAVPDKAKFDGSIDHMAFATDFSPESLQLLDRAIEFSQVFSAYLHVVNVDYAHTEFYMGRMETLKSRFKDVDKIHFSVLDANEVEAGLIQFYEQNQIDFMIMVTRKRNWLEELFQYSRTKKLSHQSSIPIMSYK
jgi:nucleotide-binding universal stress UspA family protein